MKNIFIVLFFLVFASFGQNTEKINQHKKKISNLKDKEKSLSTQLDNILKRMSHMDKEISRIKSEINDIDRRIIDISNEKKVVESKLSDNRSKQKEVIRNLYISKSDNPSLIIGMNLNPDFQGKKVYLKALSSYRRDIIENIMMLNDSLAQLISVEKSLKDSTETLFQDKKYVRNQLKDEIKRQKKTISGIKSQKAEYEKALKTLEEEARKIARLAMQNSSSVPPVSGTFPKKLPWPLKSRKILNKFGLTKESKFGTHFYNPGIDVKAHPGEKVYVVCNGFVNYVGWLRGYGNIIIVKHPDDYYTLYGNLENIFVSKGDYIDKGQCIGEVSPYGWLEGAKLHFEIRKGKKEQNPLKWLDKNLKLI